MLLPQQFETERRDNNIGKSKKNRTRNWAVMRIIAQLRALFPQLTAVCVKGFLFALGLLQKRSGNPYYTTNNYLCHIPFAFAEMLVLIESL
jgi:hypothetical protein